MGLGTRIFIVNDNHTLKRMPLKRYHRLFRRYPEERFEEYAGKRIRYVLVVLELKSRKPVEILKIQYSYLSFDPEGHLREDEREKAARLTMRKIREVFRPKFDCDISNRQIAKNCNIARSKVGEYLLRLANSTISEQIRVE